MMTAIQPLAPARLPPNLTSNPSSSSSSSAAFNNSIYNHGTHHDDDDNNNDVDDGHCGHGIDLVRYDYVRSLIWGERVGGHRGNFQSQRVFCVSLPDLASVSRNFASAGYSTRSLMTEPVLASEQGSTMATTTAMAENPTTEHEQETAPSSPPELSYSKSSKSSSSSFSLSGDDSTEKLAHFEDVTLQGEEDEDGRSSVSDCNVKPESRPTLRRPKKRSSPPGPIDTTKRPPPPTAVRENRHPSLQGALRDRSLGLPHGRSLQRGFTSPSFMTHGSQRVPSRSPSPRKLASGQSDVPLSPQTVGSLTPRTSWSASSPHPNGMLSRQQSWQPGRKTVKQLEAEYDDGDVEVPDEAILENVPITPIPGQPRSKTPSPVRRPSHPGLQAHLHANLHSAKVPKNAKRPSAPTIMPNGQYGAPRSPRHGRPPMMPHSATVPIEPLSYQHRSKSWTEDLNAEARQLSAALEEYAERRSCDKRRSGTNSVLSSPPRPKLEYKDRAKTAILELPPVQKGNIMIDPLPISKEKEAVLTRTRPSWLPPKSQKEEKKHVKEWEQMMARAAEAEKKRVMKLQEDQETKEEQESSSSRLWEDYVLPNWDVAIKEPRTRELWWRGVTPKSRGQVWQKAIGNELGVLPSTFDAALRRAHELEAQIAAMPTEEASRSPQAAWFSAIDRDVPTVYPHLGAFAQGTELHARLTSVLKAYATYRSDVGYVFGVHLIAATLCSHLPNAAGAFITLANLLNRPLPLAFLIHDPPSMTRHHAAVLSALKYKSPHLHAHLTTTLPDPAPYLDPMFRCLFAYHLPSPAHVARAWDVYVFEGDRALVRAAVAVLGRLEGRLFGGPEEILDLLSWRNERPWAVGSEEEFVSAVRGAGKVDGV